MTYDIIRNLCDGPRDYPLKNGESIYLAPKGKHSDTARVNSDLTSNAIRAAEEKGLLSIAKEVSE